MIGQIGPSVRAGGKTTLILHVAGNISGALCSGLFLCFVGLLMLSFLPPVSVAGRTAVSASVLAVGAIIDSGIPVERPSFGPKRQTPLLWACSLGRDGAAFAWGMDLGSALTTRLPYLSLVGIVIYAVLSESILQSVVILGSYGLGRSLAAIAVVLRSPDHAASCTRLGELANRFSLAASVAAFGVAVLGMTLGLR